MDGKKIGYWGVTGVLGFALLGSGAANVMGAEDVVKGITALGYPAYFPAIIGVWKVLGAIAILAPGFPRVKEWAYAGIAFLMSGAFVSHMAAGDPFSQAVPPLVILSLAVASYLLRPQSRRIGAAVDSAEPKAHGATRPEPAV